MGTIHQFLDALTTEELKNAPKLPFRGAFSTIAVMTCSRGSIFYLSELGESLFILTTVATHASTRDRSDEKEHRCQRNCCFNSPSTDYLLRRPNREHTLYECLHRSSGRHSSSHPPDSSFFVYRIHSCQFTLSWTISMKSG
jgi:hypothetical protein